MGRGQIYDECFATFFAGRSLLPLFFAWTATRERVLLLLAAAALCVAAAVLVSVVVVVVLA